MQLEHNAYMLTMLKRSLTQALGWTGQTAIRSDVNAERVLRPDVRLAHSEDRLVLLSIDSGQVFVCNHVGKRICEALAARRPAAQIAESLTREYGVTLDRARLDLAKFIDVLESHGMVMKQPVETHATELPVEARPVFAPAPVQH